MTLAERERFLSARGFCWPKRAERWWKMKNVRMTILMIAAVLVIGVEQGFGGWDILLDADTPATGSLLGTQPLLTTFGEIHFAGEIRDRDSDPEFNAIGATGNVFDIDNLSHHAYLTFDFDIRSATFIYGGNTGNILVRAINGSGQVVDSFFQADTLNGPAGPITISGSGIRSLYWEDSWGGQFAPLDNIEIVVPEPCTLSLLVLGGMGLLRRRKA
jgi:hypothetical protein